MTQDTIAWTPDLLHHFKTAYQTAVDQDEKDFNFEGHYFVRDYAKYLIQFLEEPFKEPV